MNDLNLLVQKYTIKQEHKIKRICVPIQDYLNIREIGYARVEADGRFCNINSFPPFLEYFYSENLANTQHYFSHPDLFQSGYTLAPVTFCPLFQKNIQNQYDINYVLYKLQKIKNGLEIFFFHPKMVLKKQNSKNCFKYLKNINLLDKFTNYFRKEASCIIESAMAEGFNIKVIRGQAFYEVNPRLDLLSNDLKAKQFLKKISPLTEREQQCLDLYKQGRSSQATAAILNLSQRTVEHYFDNIKTKLGCQSKMELLEW
jgi:DNA-binding CsgD family transcriptional regulator